MGQPAETRGARPPLAAIIGANVYRLRVLRLPKWSQEELAERAGIAVNTVRLVEAGRGQMKDGKSVRTDTLEALADAFDVEPSELLRWDSSSRVYLHARPHLKAVASKAKDRGRTPPVQLARVR